MNSFESLSFHSQGQMKLKLILCLASLIIGVCTIAAIDQYRRQHEKISLSTLGRLNDLGCKLYLDDEQISRQLEAGNVVTISKQDLNDKSSKKAQIFKDQFNLNVRIQSISFLMIGNELCLICKTAYTETIYMPNGTVHQIP